MEVCQNNYKNICLWSILNTELFFKVNIGKEQFKDNGQTESIMFRITLMFYTKMWKFIVIKNQFPALKFCGSHTKPHGSGGLSKHYHLRFDPKLGHGISIILRIPCACVAWTSILNQPWISGIPSKKQACYQPVTNCTYWSVLVSYKFFNTIELTPKSTPFEAFDEIHKVVIDRIRENMVLLVQWGIYGVINTDDTFNSPHRYIRYKIMQQLIDKLYLLVN